MGYLRRYRGSVTIAAAAVVPLGVAGILVPFRTTFADAAAALVFVAVIVAVAVMGTRIAGIPRHDLFDIMVRPRLDPPLRTIGDHPPR
jgi:hypothetical protein